MKVTIFGPGFLGTRLARDVPGATLVRTDIADEAAVRNALRETEADAAINCAAKTGRPNVDWCETHQEETTRTNVVGALTLARACAAAGAYLLHLGSGCIFYGDSPSPGGWREDDFANPEGFYSRTKYAADLVLSRLPHVGIVRLRMPIDGEPGARNLITKLAAYQQVVDVANSVTIVDDFVQVVSRLVERRATGVFHAANPGTMRHTQLLTLYRELVDPRHECAFISADELVHRGLAVRARSNCLLGSTRLEALGIHMPSIDVSLRRTMMEYAARVRP